MGASEWTITRVADNASVVLLLGGPSDVGFPSIVRPVFSLLPSITYVSGDGTENSPIRIL